MTHKESQARNAAIGRAVAEGMTTKEAMSAFGVRYAVVWNACRETGVRLKTCKAPGGTFLKALKLLLVDRLTPAAAALQLGIRHQMVSQVADTAEAAGIPIPFRQREPSLS